ncbi:MAG: flagellar basal body rod protein FlgC [Chromatiales bacterium]|jgi:flagellar basal-body rod protein FlgC|nr:flagellar basal body rod protein FlgC [Chromatiales bacterium]
MSLFDVLTTAGSALNAQSVRLNVTASNIANANNLSSDEEGAYRAQRPIFATLVDPFDLQSHATGVQIKEIVNSDAPLPRQYRPEHPLADEQGYVTASNVNPVEEMADMISASRSYQNSVEVMNTTKEMLLRTINLGR